MSEALNTEAAARYSGLTPWRPGQSGNPAGRPKGSRNLLTEDFLGKLRADFAKHGDQAISDLREADPGKYLSIIAGLVPRDMHLEVTGSALTGMSDETLALLARVLELLAQSGGAMPVERVFEAAVVEEQGG